jgi:hypothetical protein
LQLGSLTIRTVRTTQDVKEPNNVAASVVAYCRCLLMQMCKTIAITSKYFGNFFFENDVTA